MPYNRYVFGLFYAVLGLFPFPAQAAMEFCNRTKAPIEAALGYRERVEWVSEGWWRIEPGKCARVFGRPLTQRFYFYYAKSLAAPMPDKVPLVWAGKYELCIDTKAFRIQGDQNCEIRKFITQGFQEIDIGSSTRDYTLDFKDGTEAR
ncbi:MAG: DUF1036 domain-containing protein [Bdellovibrionales bacterium]